VHKFNTAILSIIGIAMESQLDLSYWKEPLDDLNHLIENAQSVFPEVKKHSEISWLEYTYGRFMLLAKEAYCLLSAGYPDGAMARVRTLAELTVFAFFIYTAINKGYDTTIGQKYIDHDWVRKRVLFQEQLAVLNLQKRTTEVTEQKKIFRDQLKIANEKIKGFKTKYGSDFAKVEYGWAYLAIRELNKKNGKTIDKCGSREPCCDETCCENPCCKELRVTLASFRDAIDAGNIRYILELGNKAVHAGPFPSIIVFNDPSLENRLICFGPVSQGLSEPIRGIGFCLQVILSLAYAATNEDKIKTVAEENDRSFNKIWPATMEAEKKALDVYKKTLKDLGLRDEA
jgi:hypothetical protein